MDDMRLTGTSPLVTQHYTVSYIHNSDIDVFQFLWFNIVVHTVQC